MLADALLKEAIRINADCRQHGVAFVKADIRGVFASVFTDFGDSFVVLDVDGVQSARFDTVLLYGSPGPHSG